MNQTQPYMDMHAGPHISSGPSYSQPAPAGPMSHYPQYQQPSPMQSGHNHYAPGPQYPNYGYGANVTSPQTAGPQMQQGLPLPAMVPAAAPQHSYGPASGGPQQPYASQQPFDTTGQVAPPGMKPRVTATLWEDEGSLCFQVEAKGVCVARREDNHFINGTKLLNVAGMTRGRRDGILKSEKVRHVVKIGPMHLKGVWIPFDRALEFANKEKITDQLYPLFVHNIGGLLYNPESTGRTNAAVAAGERRRMESTDGSRSAQTSQPPSLHHHHSIQGSIGGQVPPSPHSIAPHPNAGRPGIDRAHTFPTPPTSASSVMGMGTSGSSYNDWSSQNMPNGVNGSQPLSIDTTLSNARSMPTTPATTPPGNSVSSMQPYPGHAGYDSNKHFYATTPSSQNGYAQQTNARYDAYNKSDMGPPTAPGSGSADAGQHEHKSEYASGHVESEASDHHENGYLNNPAATYGSTRSQYAYHPAADHQHLSPEMTSSPSHPSGSGRGTPRTMPAAQPQWSQDYQTPPRVPNQTGMYNAVAESRSSTAPGSMDSYIQQPTYSNSMKRRRDDDDHDGRPASRELDGAFDPKRQKMQRAETFGVPLGQNVHMQAIKTGGMSRR